MYVFHCRQAMSVYDRAVRPVVKPVGSTGMHVGPGAYDVELTAKSKIKSGEYGSSFHHGVIFLYRIQC